MCEDLWWNILQDEEWYDYTVAGIPNANWEVADAENGHKGKHN